MAFAYIFSVIILLQSGVIQKVISYQSTSIGIGFKATEDESIIIASNNNCKECDIRITHVPSQNWSKGSKRPIFDICDKYPRYVEPLQENIHGPMYLKDESKFDGEFSKPLIYIDQIDRTFGYTLGAHAIQNEKQVSLGESVCSAKFIGKPIGSGGKASMHIGTLTELALERCQSAQCAVRLMGDMSFKYGFYGKSWDTDDGYLNAGHAVIVSDNREIWVFHVLADDTGSSAIWAAQKLPDDHITVVANQFIIGEICLSCGYQMASENVFMVAARNGLWDPTEALIKPFHFARVYGRERGGGRLGYVNTRRMWRVLTLAAPSLLPRLSPFTDDFATFGFGEDGWAAYPLSVRPDSPISLQFAMRLTRDRYEGTLFDLTAGIAAGPFGDPQRLGSRNSSQSLQFEQPIAISGGLCSLLSQSRAWLPDRLALTWVAPHGPDASFVPVYASLHAPPSLGGTRDKFDRRSNWWIHCLVSNYLSRWYRYSAKDVAALQQDIETRVFLRLQAAEQQEMAHDKNSEVTLNATAASSSLQQFQDDMADEIGQLWWQFFFRMTATYRDGYKLVNPHAEDFNSGVHFLDYSRGWLEQLGYWGRPFQPPPSGRRPVPLRPVAVPSEPTQAAYEALYKGEYSFPPPLFLDGEKQQQAAQRLEQVVTTASIGATMLGVVLGMTVALMVWTHCGEDDNLGFVSPASPHCGLLASRRS